MKNTPWGKADFKTELAEGIVSYATPSHGGIWLSKQRQNQLPYHDNFLKDPTWWEEDCDWAVPYVFFAGDIRNHGAYKFEENYKQAIETVRNWHPEFYNKYCKSLHLKS